MVTRDEVVWAYRMFLGREPENNDVIEAKMRHSTFELRRSMVASSEFKSKALMLERPDQKHWMKPDDVREVYLGVIRREPSDSEIAEAYRNFPTSCELAADLFEQTDLATQKYQGRIPRLVSTDYERLYDRFTVAPTPRSGCSVGPLGDTMDVRYVAGTTEGISRTIPRTAEYWTSLCAAVHAQEGEFTAVELGAGWGPWLVRSGAAARQLGIPRIKFAAVEADIHHFDYLQEHLSRNGFPPSDHNLLHGIVSSSDGVAYFPNVEDPDVNWGASAISTSQYEALASNASTPRNRRGETFIETKSYSVQSVIAPFNNIDLMHVDIQGSELEAISAAVKELGRKVRFLFVGTHSHAIEVGLIHLLADERWRLVHYLPRRYMRDRDGRHVGTMDGEQVWINASVVLDI